MKFNTLSRHIKRTNVAMLFHERIYTKANAKKLKHLKLLALNVVNLLLGKMV